MDPSRPLLWRRYKGTIAIDATRIDAMGKAVNPGKGKRGMYEAGEHTIQETADTFDVSQPTLSFSSQSAAAPSSAP